ncbi:MAG: phosphatidylglycerophosphatase A, partial [Planctomycetota bacterium]|nr:phosphatidylglycerophosphatase A [Planctomycetota bacterium]
MAKAYSSDVCHQLADMADGARLLRPCRITRHEVGDVLELDLRGVAPAWKARAAFQIDQYAGGGFAGQVYRARLARLDWPEDTQVGPPLTVGATCALKMFVPWSRFGRWFRGALYGLGFQTPFGLQANPQAARACALWHKFIRCGAAGRLGSERAVVDVFATFHDPVLGSMGEVLEWVDGRVWQLEVNEELFAPNMPGSGSEASPAGDEAGAEHGGSAEPPRGTDGEAATEYAGKREFMRRLVGLFHDMGAPELARQYEWWTMKSQPNVLKRLGAKGDAAEGLTAVDFGAGLALWPFLPMSPADVRLIAAGLGRGRLVQFDRGDLDRLEAYLHAHPHLFEGMGAALAELRAAEAAYHGAQPDLANRRLGAFADRALPAKVARAWAEGYRVRGLMDRRTARRTAARPEALLVFLFVGLVPLVGRFVQRVWGSGAYWRHVREALTNLDYLKRTIRGRACEKLIDWHRKGRVSETRALALARHPVWFWLQALTLGFLPAGLHRFLTDARYAWDVFRYVVVRPVALFFSRARRERWLREMVEDGRAEGVLAPDEADHILGRIKEPFIQTYLLSMVVHLCTVPVTQIVSVVLGAYLAARYGGSAAESGAIFGGTVVIFQVLPLSPGSLTRGLYATGLALWKRDWKNYAVAVAISYWKYVGYLGFPIQMVHQYPTLARFMATQWATHAIRVVPVFGEHGALLEHGVFTLFFNVPVSLRRKWQAERPWRRRVRGLAGLAGTWLGVGHLPGPSGTAASAVVAGLVLILYYLGVPLWAVVAAAATAAVAGVPIGTWFERRLERHDPRPFVLDEVAGMLIAAVAAWMPTAGAGWLSLLLAFAWFRLFDILKPPPVR